MRGTHTGSHLPEPAVSGLPLPWTEHFAVTDPDACAEHIRVFGTRVRHNQMSHGRYSAAIDTAILPGLRVSRTAYGPAITSRGAPPQSQYALLMPVSDVAGVFCNHRPISEDEIGLTPPGREFHVYRPPAFQCLTVFPDADRIDRLSHAMFGRTFTQLVARMIDLGRE